MGTERIFPAGQRGREVATCLPNTPIIFIKYDETSGSSLYLSHACGSLDTSSIARLIRGLSTAEDSCNRSRAKSQNRESSTAKDRRPSMNEGLVDFRSMRGRRRAHNLLILVDLFQQVVAWLHPLWHVPLVDPQILQLVQRPLLLASRLEYLRSTIITSTCSAL